MHRPWVPVVLVLGLCVAGCAAPATATPTSAPVAAGPSAVPATELSGKISVAGSTSVQPLAEKLAEAFSAANPKVQIDVLGGGSGVGVKSAGDGTVDIGTCSRDLKAEEKTTYPDMKSIVIARDAIAVVANNNVALTGLTKGQVKDIFSGKIGNWKDLGGADKPIVVVAREEGSGTRDAFQTMVMGQDTIAATAILQNSNGALRTAVSTTPDAIGFLSLGYLDDSLKALTLDGVEPTPENALGGTYPLVRPFNLLTRGEPTGLVKAWIDWILSPAGQQVVTQERYLALK